MDAEDEDVDAQDQGSVALEIRVGAELTAPLIVSILHLAPICADPYQIQEFSDEWAAWKRKRRAYAMAVG
jgi:hypothetical protein